MDETLTSVRTITNVDRINAVIFALNRLPHDQVAVGLGFKLKHNPQRCARCIAFTCLMQLGSIVNVQESDTAAEDRRGEDE